MLRRLVLFVAFACGAIVVVPSAASGQAGSAAGDVNCDSTVDIIDALVIAQYVAQVRTEAASCPLADPATELVLAQGDVDRSGVVDIIDALEIAQCTAGIPNFACPAQVFEIPEPFAVSDVDISSDGFVPIPVGDRVYAIERAGTDIACADLLTGLQCWAPRSLLDGAASGTTMAVTRSRLVGTNIYFLFREGDPGQLPTTATVRVGCWDTTLDQLCAQSAVLPGAVSGAIHVGDDAIYAFTEQRRVHCVTIPALATCAGYEVALATSLLSEPDWVSAEGSSAWHSDVVALNDRIYSTLSDSGAVWLHCWDAATSAPCVGFEASIVNDTSFATFDDARAGRLFFHRSTSGDATAICSQGVRDGVDCRDLVTGAEAVGSEAALSTVAGRIAYGDDALGISAYDPETNRQLFVGTNDESTTYCHDFDTDSYCGSFSAFANGVDTAGYGYAIVDDCAIGLGDAGVLYFMDPSSLSSGCGGPVPVTEIDQCGCPGTWPRLKAVGVDGVSQFLIDVRNQDFEQVALIDALATDTVDLNTVAGDARRLRFVYSVLAAPGADPWSDGEPPTILFG